MNEFVLKKLNKDYCSSLYFFQKRFKELENNIWEIDQLNNLITRENYFAKLCFKNKSIIGFCIGNQVFDIFEIYSIFVHPFYRRNGVAKKILHECITFCKKKKVKKIILEVNIQNDAAKKFYSLNEFKNCGVRKDYYFSESGRNDAQLMELKIIE